MRGGCGLGSAKAGSSPHCNGCFDVFCLFLHIAVTWCFDIFAAERIVMAPWMLHGLRLGRKPGQETLCFPCIVAPAGDERYLVCGGGAGWVRPRLGVVRIVMAASMCFAYSCTLQLHGVLESLLAERIVMAAWMLHGLRFGRKPGQETSCFSV